MGPAVDVHRHHRGRTEQLGRGHHVLRVEGQLGLAQQRRAGRPAVQYRDGDVREARRHRLDHREGGVVTADVDGRLARRHEHEAGDRPGEALGAVRPVPRGHGGDGDRADRVLLPRVQAGDRRAEAAPLAAHLRPALPRGDRLLAAAVAADPAGVVGVPPQTYRAAFRMS
jgi:hypothetical protein